MTSITIHDLRAWKRRASGSSMLTAYDFPTAQILDEAGIPVLLVGDSVGSNVLGYANDAAGDDGGHAPPHEGGGARRRARDGGRRHAVHVATRSSVDDGVRNAGRLLKEGGAHAVKVEGPQLELVHRLVDLGIPVMAHVGLTPQSVHGMGGYKVQGRGEEAAHEAPGAGARRSRRPARSPIVLEGDAGRRSATTITASSADPDDRHRRRARHRRPGARDQRPARV